MLNNNNFIADCFKKAITKLEKIFTICYNKSCDFSQDLLFRSEFFTLKIKNFLLKVNDKVIIYMLFASIFLPFFCTALIIAIACFYIVINKKIVGCFEKNGGFWIILFSIYCSIIAIVNLNFVGLAATVAFVALIIVAKFIRKYITINLLEKGFDIICIMSVITSVFCLIDFIYNQYILSYKGVYRCTLYFFNCNYLATLFATVILICVYKLLNHIRNPFFYYIVAVFCALGAHFTGSMFVWVEVFIGCSALLLLIRKQQLLSSLFLLAGTFVIVLYCIPSIMPRINESNITTDNRIIIWKTTLNAISDATPLLGKGFLTYFNIKDNYAGSYNTAHSHSIFLEPILSFGIIGTIFIVIYFLYFYKRVRVCRNAQHKYCISSLIIAVSLAILVHSTTDLTFMWIQTGLFYCLIFSSIGIEERFLKIEK